MAQKFKSDKEREREVFFFGEKFKPQNDVFSSASWSRSITAIKDGERDLSISTCQQFSWHISRSSSRLPSLSDGYVGQETPFAFQFGLDNVSLFLSLSLSLPLSHSVFLRNESRFPLNPGKKVGENDCD